MNAIVAINAAYVEAKGKTFFANQLLLENPLTTDGFINDTLEHLRQMARIGISRGDEEQIEQTLAEHLRHSSPSTLLSIIAAPMPQKLTLTSPPGIYQKKSNA